MKIKREVNFKGNIREVSCDIPKDAIDKFRFLNVSEGRVCMLEAFNYLPVDAQRHIAASYYKKHSERECSDRWRIKKILESGNFDSVKDVLEQVASTLKINIKIVINAVS